jgi:hypothetical protein
MYCPNCATEMSFGQKFCRSCGISLQMISQVLTGQESRPTPQRPEPDRVELIEGAIQNFRGRQRRRKAFILAPLIVLLAIITLGFNMPESSVPIAILIGVILGRYSGAFKFPHRRGNQDTAPLLARSPIHQTLSGGYESIPSVTEHTTRTLERSRHKRA